MPPGFPARLLHGGVESGVGDDLVDALGSFQRQEFGQDVRREERRDARNAVEVLPVVAAVPFFDDALLQGFALLHEIRRGGDGRHLPVFLEVPLVHDEVGGDRPQLPVVADDCFLPRHLLGLDEAVAVVLGGEEGEMRHVHLVGLALPDGKPRDLFGIQGIHDLHEKSAVRQCPRRLPVVRPRAFEEDGCLAVHAAFPEMDDEPFGS